MNKWIKRCLELDATETTPETPETPISGDIGVGFGGFGGTFPDTLSKNDVDPESILERAGIHEYDGELPRDEANRLASMDADRRRTPVDAPEVMARYWAYLKGWAPAAVDDLPVIPPCAPGNGPLWQAWWRRMEGRL